MPELVAVGQQHHLIVGLQVKDPAQQRVRKLQAGESRKVKSAAKQWG